MKHLKITIASLLVLSSAMVWASGPSHANAILQEDSIFQSSGTNATDLAQYGISTVWYKRLEFGAKVGINFTGAPNFLSNSLFSPVFGGTMALPFGNIFALRMEILYSQDVFSGEQTTNAEPTTYTNRLSYFDVPLMVRVKPVASFDGDFVAGGDFQLLVANGYKYEATSNAILPVHKTPSSTAVGWMFGLEYSIYQATFCFRVTGNVPDNGNLKSATTMVGQFTMAYTIPTP